MFRQESRGEQSRVGEQCLLYTFGTHPSAIPVFMRVCEGLPLSSSVNHSSPPLPHCRTPLPYPIRNFTLHFLDTFECKENVNPLPYPKNVSCRLCARRSRGERRLIAHFYSTLLFTLALREKSVNLA